MPGLSVGRDEHFPGGVPMIFSERINRLVDLFTVLLVLVTVLYLGFHVIKALTN